jgi:uncharacterized protein
VVRLWHGSMVARPDYGLVDRRGLTWGLFWPRHEASPPPPGAADHRVEVAEGVHLACRCYALDRARPTVLLFHGNGEVASDYDTIAPAYHEIGANLVVADYRGYGRSDGTPSFASLIADAHPVLSWFHAHLDSQGCAGLRFIMGRSLGSLPAAELAATEDARLAGLIIESGAPDLTGLARRAGVDERAPEIATLIAAHTVHLASIRLPLLQIHGDCDNIIPLEYAVAFHEQMSCKQKEFLLIDGAGHNDIGWVGRKPYFATLGRFIHRP